MPWVTAGPARPKVSEDRGKPKLEYEDDVIDLTEDHRRSHNNPLDEVDTNQDDDDWGDSSFLEKPTKKKPAPSKKNAGSFEQRRRERRERDAKVRSGEQELPSAEIKFKFRYSAT